MCKAADMGLVRLLAREGAGIILTFDAVLADEIAFYRLAAAPFDPYLTETFNATIAHATFRMDWWRKCRGRDRSKLGQHG